VADITERKEDEIRKNEFLAIASHELKTPLTSVKAYTQLLSATYQKKGDEFLKNALGKVENQVNKMTKLVGDFLNLSKIESDKFELQSEKFELSAVVKEVSSDIQLVAPNHRISVVDGQPVTIEGDSEKIAQVVTNFLTNAIKYSPEGKEITVTVTHDDKFARVSVRDEGIGVKQEEQNQIFQRFYRSKFNQNISYSGFGIGLYISAEIIQKHEGTIGVESREGKGSIFYFTLPLAR
jgi:signal transduction histidine kinase